MTRVVAFVLGSASGVLLLSVALLLHDLYGKTQVHVLEAPMVLRANDMDDHLHLLPKGTTLYYDRSFSEGFTRYKVYVNIDRTPLALATLADPTMVDPINAAWMDADERKRAQGQRMPGKEELRALLASGALRRSDLEALLAEAPRARK